MQMSANLALGDNVLHGLQMAAFSLCTHMVEGKRTLVSLLCIRAQMPSWELLS